jgi:hypothetical protein
VQDICSVVMVLVVVAPCHWINGKAAAEAAVAAAERRLKHVVRQKRERKKIQKYFLSYHKRQL